MLCAGGIVLLWSVLLLYTQGRSSFPSFEHHWVVPKMLFRCFLNVLFTASLVLILPRPFTAIVLFLSAFCGVGLIVYADYFGETMSVMTLFANFHEGFAVRGAIVHLIPPRTACVFALIAVLCCLLLFLGGRPSFSYRWRALAAFFLAAFYSSIVFGLGFIGEMSCTRLVGSYSKQIGDLTPIYGYLPVWIAELWIKDESAVCAAATAQPRTDRLTPIETPLDLPDRVVVVQIETLDFNIIDRTLNGKTVTPFLNELRTKSFFYKVDSFHHNGSADADFAFLTGQEPSRDKINYKIKSFVYRDTLVEAFNDHGYRTHSFHNGHALFFNRHAAFRNIRFQEIDFIERLVEKHGLVTQRVESWNSVPDDVLLGIVADEVAAEKGKGFFFAITMFTHTPYRAILEQDIYPDSSSLLHRYVNSIHVVDRQLKEFYEKLPKGTLLVVYGDHSSNITDADYVARNKNEKDYVPFMISIVGESIADRQRIGSEQALGGDLTLVDLSNYLRSLLTPEP